jgi:protein ImuB
MWWIALYLPQWPLEALGTPRPDAVEDAGSLLCVGAAAAQAGVRPGMSRAAAELCWSGLKLRPRQPEQEARALRTLALASLRFSPNLQLRPDGLLIEVQASLRLFGGPLRLWQQFQRVIASFEVSIHWAAAPFPEAAWLLARARGPGRQAAGRQARALGPPLGVAQSRQAQAVRPALDALPVPLVLQAWQAPPATAQLLEGWGVATLGQWRALPRAGLQRRLGLEAMQRLDRAYGLVPDPRPFWAPPAAFDERLDLPERSSDLGLMARALNYLLQALEGWLLAQGRLARALTLHLLHETRRHEAWPDTVYPLHLAAAERAAEPLQRLWAERLQRQAVVAPVAALRLVLQVSEPAESRERQRALPWAPRAWGGPPQDLQGPPGAPGLQDLQDPADTRQALARLLDRLQARLGERGVQGLRCHDDHRPEKASARVALTGLAPSPPSTLSSAPAASPLGAAGQPPQLRETLAACLPAAPRPFWLLAEPEPLGEHQGRPVHQGAVLVLRSRPERIEAGWFDGEPVCRDYQVAEGPDHRLRWVFRERRGPQPAWFLHGWFN